jgi:hypothetical protein
MIHRSVRLLRSRSVFLRNFLALAGEWPFAFQWLHLFANGFGYVVDFEIFQYMDAELSCTGNV